jgi:hypothetical protein
MNNDCVFCGIDTHGSGVTAGNSRLSCTLCWEQRHPFRPRETFREVLLNGEDHTLVWELLDCHVSKLEQAKIVMEFNATMAERYCKRLDALLAERHEREQTDFVSKC